MQAAGSTPSGPAVTWKEGWIQLFTLLGPVSACRALSSSNVKVCFQRINLKQSPSSQADGSLVYLMEFVVKPWYPHVLLHFNDSHQFELIKWGV